MPLAKWIVSRTPGWQVWSVERRENLLEDQSELNLYKQGKVTSTAAVRLLPRLPQGHQHHAPLPADPGLRRSQFAKQWGMNVAVQDLHTVIGAAKKLGGKVVLGGHSLGGSVVTAYATWNFNGNAGADDLAGLVYIDGGSRHTPVQRRTTGDPGSASAQRADSRPRGCPSAGSPRPTPGVFNATGSAAALLDPELASLGQASGLLPTDIVPPVPVTNVGQYGYALNVDDLTAKSLGQPRRISAPASSPRGRSTVGTAPGRSPRSTAFATMFSGFGDPERRRHRVVLPPAAHRRHRRGRQRQRQSGAERARRRRRPWATICPTSLLIYAFGAHLGGAAVLVAAQILAKQSGIPLSNLTLVNRQSTYAHNDPAGAYPSNVFFDHLVPFLKKV